MDEIRNDGLPVSLLIGEELNALLLIRGLPALVLSDRVRDHLRGAAVQR